MIDVAIIGGGAAGLAAARRAMARGLSHHVFEASARLGGRVISHRGEHGVVELGAEYIHGANAVTWKAVRAANIETYPFSNDYSLKDGSARKYGVGGKLIHGESAFGRDVEHWYEKADEVCDEDISLAEWFASRAPQTREARMAMNRIARIEAADASRLSARWLALEHAATTNGTENYRFKHGYDQLIDALAKGVTHTLQCPITHVRWSDEGAVVVDWLGKEHTARHVVITIPLSLLQQGALRFDPVLPQSKIDALHRLDMGNVYKMAFFFRQVCWPQFTFLSTDSALTTFWPVLSTKLPVMMNFTAGPAAQLLSGLGERAAIEFGIAALRGYFGSDVEQHFAGAKTMDWSLQPWIRGAYSYTPVGGRDARAILRQPLGALHFAGEATGDNGHHATVHGAIESGERAIDELPAARAP